MQTSMIHWRDPLYREANLFTERLISNLFDFLSADFYSLNVDSSGRRQPMKVSIFRLYRFLAAWAAHLLTIQPNQRVAAYRAG